MAVATPETHMVCVDESDIILLQDGMVVLQEKTTGDLCYTEYNREFCENFTLEYIENEKIVNTKKTTKANWCRNGTLIMLDQYKKNIKEMFSTKIKNDSVWGFITKGVNEAGYPWTGVQCKDRFHYLRNLYIKKKDNMNANKSSGAAPMKFEFFDQMEEILGKKPNVEPKNIASSSREISVDEICSPPPSKKKKQMGIDVLAEIENRKMDARERHHQENLTLKREALAAFKDATTLLENITKKE